MTAPTFAKSAYTISPQHLQGNKPSERVFINTHNSSHISSVKHAFETRKFELKQTHDERWLDWGFPERQQPGLMFSTIEAPCNVKHPWNLFNQVSFSCFVEAKSNVTFTFHVSLFSSSFPPLLLLFVRTFKSMRIPQFHNLLRSVLEWAECLADDDFYLVSMMSDDGRGFKPRGRHLIIQFNTEARVF